LDTDNAMRPGAPIPIAIVAAGVVLPISISLRAEGRGPPF
jgi:hypothetical protein